MWNYPIGPTNNLISEGNDEVGKNLNKRRPPEILIKRGYRENCLGSY
jgi:hypothetical protein